MFQMCTESELLSVVNYWACLLQSTSVRRYTGIAAARQIDFALYKINNTVTRKIDELHCRVYTQLYKC